MQNQFHEDPQINWNLVNASLITAFFIPNHCHIVNKLYCNLNGYVFIEISRLVI